jgi:hypothetical protein
MTAKARKGKASGANVGLLTVYFLKAKMRVRGKRDGGKARSTKERGAGKAEKASQSAQAR